MQIKLVLRFDKIKIMIKRYFLIVALAVSFFSCEDDQELTPNPAFGMPNVNGTGSNGNSGGSTGSGSQFMDFTIDGVKTNYPVCYFDTNFGNFQIRGLSSTNNLTAKDITFEFPTTSTPVEDSVYVMIDFSTGGYITYYSKPFSLDDADIYFSEVGEVRFSKITSSVMEGTFSFDAKSADDQNFVKVTTGTFKAVPR